MRAKDMSGVKCGRLTVVSRVHNPDSKAAVWLCTCECGNVVQVAGYRLRLGVTKSCGCLPRQRMSLLRRVHGYTGTKTWIAWCSMISRYVNKSFQYYCDYGGRGITVCSRWREKNGVGFTNFLKDMGECPHGLTLGRIDNDGGYCPENCSWQTIVEQARNKRTSLIASDGKESLPLVCWSERTSIRYHTLRARLKLGWSEIRTITTPLMNTRRTVK